MKAEILAPVGDRNAFLAALAAGADAVYLGLKNFSARMEAENFGTLELSRMVELAESEHRKVYVAFNTLIKAEDLPSVGHLLMRLVRDVHPHGIILQDIGLIDLARQTGYEGGLFLSTLANLTHPKALLAARQIGADRVILPRELSIDEVRQVAESCPEGLDLEIFVHGALCWCVSGRCYWSSYMGGKSGLRGRCVQPCRRVYTQHGHSGRFFSCLDLSLDVLTKTLTDIPHLASWKIEGRKKGAHYVYHVVTAYKMIRDNPNDAAVRREAEQILQMALGRPTTRAQFLPQHATEPTSPAEQTSSGLLAGKVQTNDKGQVFFKPHFELIDQDYLRLGYEDERWHSTFPVRRRVPKAGTFVLSLPKQKTPKSGTPIFLIDRREPELLRILKTWGAKLDSCQGCPATNVDFTPNLPKPERSKRWQDMVLRASIPHGTETRAGRVKTALWLSPKSVREISRTVVPRLVWWMPPVIWPSEEALWEKILLEALRKGMNCVVCNSPWQAAFFKNLQQSKQGKDQSRQNEDQTRRNNDQVGQSKALTLIAGPFCNVANPMALACLKNLGFTAAFVSPELEKKTLLSLPALSPLPLGFVLQGFWPVGISRHTPEGLKMNEPFQSPKGETFWTRNYGQNTWVYPAWPLDFSEHRKELESAGYSFFATMEEILPKTLPQTKRPGLFNWDMKLL